MTDGTQRVRLICNGVCVLDAHLKTYATKSEILIWNGRVFVLDGASAETDLMIYREIMPWELKQADIVAVERSAISDIQPNVWRPAMDLRARDFELLRVALLPEAKQGSALANLSIVYSFDAEARWCELVAAGLIDDYGLTAAGKNELSPPVATGVGHGSYVARREVIEAWRYPFRDQPSEPMPEWLMDAFRRDKAGTIGDDIHVNLHNGQPLPGEAPCRYGDWIYKNSLGALGVITGRAFALKYARLL